MRKYKIFGQEEVLVLKEKYLLNDYLAIKIFDINYTKEIATITTLIKGAMSERHKVDYVYLDIIKYPCLEEFIKENDIGYPTGHSFSIDKNVYPEYNV